MNNTELDKMLRDILEKETYIDDHDGNMIGYEIYVDYQEQISNSQLAQISRSDDPTCAYAEVEDEWIFNASEYEFVELMRIISENMDDFDEHEDEIRDWIQDNVYWYLPSSVAEQEVDVVLSLDTGDCDSDFTQCNILNWYGIDGGYCDKENPLPKESPIRWLAEQQGKLKEIEKMLSLEFDEYVVHYDGDKFSKFTQSVKQELENASSHMNTLVFLCKMSLKEFLDFRYHISEEKELNNSYIYSERKGTGAIKVTKNAMCGLYDIWNGGGSVLEIELEKDVVIPYKAIFQVWIDCPGCKANGLGYDVSDVYGFDSSAFTGEIKEV